MGRLFTCVMRRQWDYFPRSARWAHLSTGVNIVTSRRSARNDIIDKDLKKVAVIVKYVLLIYRDLVLDVKLNPI